MHDIALGGIIFAIREISPTASGPNGVPAVLLTSCADVPAEPIKLIRSES